MFCTPSDFNLKPYDIPNLSQVPNTFPLYIEKREEEVLTKLLGVSLYQEFMLGLQALPPLWDSATDYGIGDVVVYGNDIWTAIEANGGYPPSTDTAALWELTEEGNIWLKLKNGFSFYVGSVEHEYLGVVDLLVPYIFYRWTRDTFDSNSGIGIVQGKAENSEVIAPKRRLVDAFNDYADKAEYLAAFIQTSNTPDVVYSNYNYYCVEPIHLNTFGI